MSKSKMWIGGEWVNAESGKTYTVYNPSTEEEIARLPLGGKADVDKAVEAAHKAFPLWWGKTQAERSQIVSQIADAMVANAQEIAEIDAIDHGMPISTIRGMAPAFATYVQYAAETSRALMGDIIPLRNESLNFLRREPRGVCALITPWNVPLMMITNKLGAALAAGNACVIKPPSVNSLEALKLAEILEKIGGLPAGTVNFVTGPGEAVGESLAAHPGIDYISFTGSSDTGKRIMALASQNVTPVHMEGGGKNPFIVLEDANLDSAVSTALFAAFFNTGMVCASPGRYYIHEKLHDKFVEKFVAAAKKVVVGNAMDEKTMMGPVVSAEHRDRVENHIKKGIEEGAKLVLGGKRPTKPPLNKGYFVMPTVFTGVKQNMTIAREEIFGPVVCFMEPFSDDDEVIKLANDNDYGLSASVWTASTVKWMKFVRELKVGTCWVNDHLSIFPDVPWGGCKVSGFGKESSVSGLKEYTWLKLVNVELSDPPIMPWPLA